MVTIAGSAQSEFAGAAKQGLTPDVSFYIGRNIILFGYHIHHFYFGILLIAIAGWIALVGSNYLTNKHAALIYGTGLGLFMDEIGLLLTWGDYYSSLTYILSLFLAGVFLNIIFFTDFWSEVRNFFLESKPRSIIINTLTMKTSVIRAGDKLSNNTSKASQVFTGIVYLGVGVLILLYPRFVYYWVAGVFMLQGVISLARAWKKE